MRRLPHWVRYLGVLVVLGGAPIAWYLGSPLFINKVVDEPFPSATAPRSVSIAPSDAAQGAIVARGTFSGVDEFHKGEGIATIVRTGADTLLRLDSFNVTNGPDLHVILTKSASPKTRADVEAGYVGVAKLKGNVGSQNYALPKDLVVSEYKAVVIYCAPFHVVFATAPLRPGP